MVTDVYKTNTRAEDNSNHSDHYPILGFFDPDNIGTVDQAKVAVLVAMGFEKDKAIAALKKFNNDVQKAVDHILSSGGGKLPNLSTNSANSDSSNSEMYSFF